MARETFRVEGLRELGEALQELSKATGRNVLKRALTRAAEPMEAHAEALAPSLTGELRAGLDTGTRLSARQSKLHRAEVGTLPAVTVGGFRSNPAKGVYVFIGPRGSAKSIVQEFGAAHQAPRPYMRPAWDGGKVQALGSIKDALAEEIDKAAQRAARKAARELAKLGR
jgi:HK97 gp10 family phage protein